VAENLKRGEKSIREEDAEGSRDGQEFNKFSVRGKSLPRNFANS